jgi:hypothetical protein
MAQHWSNLSVTPTGSQTRGSVVNEVVLVRMLSRGDTACYTSEKLKNITAAAAAAYNNVPLPW